MNFFKTNPLRVVPAQIEHALAMSAIIRFIFVAEDPSKTKSKYIKNLSFSQYFSQA